MISGLNHAVLYVRDSERQRKFYEDVLGFATIINAPGQYAFMRTQLRKSPRHRLLRHRRRLRRITRRC